MSHSEWQIKRHQLHQIAELSNHESATAQAVIDTLKQYQPSKIITHVGGYGVLAIYQGKKPGPTTLFRAELDALPIEENHTLEYRSHHTCCAHKCGHDGHMTIILSLAKQLHNTPPESGRVILAFQSAEETGEGAKAMIQDDVFRPYVPDYAFALHNYPGLELGRVGIKSGTFNCASKGMIIELTGHTSHAAYPEHGNSPAIAMCELIQLASDLPNQIEDTCWCTVIYSKLGEIAFGTSPGQGVVMLTLRSETNFTMNQLQARLAQAVEKLCSKYQLSYDIKFQDEFDATTNDELATKLVSNSCEKLNIQYDVLNQPMRWSEDFGQFTEVARHGALFVLGSGESTPQLHHPDYDFPDKLLPIGKDLFLDLIENINQFEK
ncbi:amidohydrolase [Vibrio sp. RC27]